MLELNPVEKARPPAPYIGGKRLLAKTIIAQIDAIDHKSYIEPFLGMGGVFFRRGLPARSEVINDRSGEVSNLFRILQRHYQAFEDMLRYSVSSRDEFERLKRVNPALLTDLERALRFLYIQTLAFGGKVTSPAFGVRVNQSARFHYSRLRDNLQAVSERLSGVTIENLDYLECLRRYDHQRALFYLDPPYWGSENSYGKALFTRKEYRVMAEALGKLNGAFLLSLNDVEEIRDIFADFEIRAVTVSYSVKRNGHTRANELIISNRTLK